MLLKLQSHLCSVFSITLNDFTYQIKQSFPACLGDLSCFLLLSHFVIWDLHRYYSFADLMKPSQLKTILLTQRRSDTTQRSNTTPLAIQHKPKKHLEKKEKTKKLCRNLNQGRVERNLELV